jgi:cobyrinic acid a,c-diamide synthase
VVEHAAAVGASVRRLAGVVARSRDLGGLERLARAAPPRRAVLPRPATRTAEPGTSVPLAVASGPAFSFAYPENLERLQQAGAELCPFDPLESATLPAGARGLYAGGGFPEVYAERLAANAPMLEAVRSAVRGGLPTWAECGGMLWLSRSLDGVPLCGAIPADATMGSKVAVGYRRAEVRRTSPVAVAGTTLRGHEHHYSEVTPTGDALTLSATTTTSAAAPGSGSRSDGWATDTMLATYLHLHLGADPAPAERFVAVAQAAISVPAQAAGNGRGKRDRR